jgi:hypothetical protein
MNSNNARATGPTTVKSVFDGIWRPHYEPPGPEEMPDIVSLAGGIYECHSCRPPYRVAADGQEHPVEANPRFETLAISVVDDWTVTKVGRRQGAVVFESTTIVAPDGLTTTETRTAATMVGQRPGSDHVERPVLFGIRSARVGPATADAHLVSGTWRVVELDLINHDEDTTYRVVDDSLTMSDRIGRSYTAGFDGTVAPYLGDPRFTGVSVRLVDDRTIEESNYTGDEVVQVTRWRVDPDGTTMHVRFDDTHGHVMEQTGHKLRGIAPPSPIPAAPTTGPIE